MISNYAFTPVFAIAAVVMIVFVWLVFFSGMNKSLSNTDMYKYWECEKQNLTFVQWI